MSSFSTGLSALTTSQRALEIIGNNIANANTPGYHRQVANLASRFPTEQFGLSIGSGVEINDVRRLRSSLIESAVTRHTFELGNLTAQLDTLRRVESVLSAGDTTLHDRLEAFFNQLEQLAGRPADATLRRVSLGSAEALTHEFNSVAADLDRLREGLDAQIEGVVGEINPLARRIADLNAVIQRSEVRGVKANDLRDQRDQLINRLAEHVDVRVIEQHDGQTTVLAGGVPLVVGNTALELRATADEAGDAVVTIAAYDEPLTFAGGQLGGLLQVRNQRLVGFRQRLDAIARELIRGIDGVHATGIGLTGEFTYLSGHRGVSDPATTLDAAGLPFPLQAGSLIVSVTEQATGQRTLTEVAIDPATQSLQDVATAISAVSHVQALVDAQTGTLKILAQPGYTFDFAGRLGSGPATAAITGTTVAQIGGKYTGATNDEFTFRVVGSGTIGVTPNLSLHVENAAGAVIATMDVGQGYEPGSELQVAGGVTVRLASGTANAGDTFATPVVARPDTVGILAALGLNSFFVGDGASDIAVHADVADHPARLAASQSGAAGDGSNLRDMAALRDAQLLAAGTRTLSESLVAVIGDVATQVQELSEQRRNQELIGQSLESQQQSISGVDPNEELVKLVQFQRAFRIASRYIDVVNQTLDDLVRII